MHSQSAKNIGMALEQEKGRNLAHERLQTAFLVRARIRRQTITPDGTQGCSVIAAHVGNQTSFLN
jgi:hypothetical protein